MIGLSESVVPAAELRKPVDTGNGVLAASFGADGCWLSVGRAHDRHGFVELSGMPPFDERWRRDPDAVRRYRTWMTEERFGFLRLELPGEDEAARVAGLDATGRPVWRRRGDGWSCEAAAWAPAGRAEVVQRYVIRSGPAGPGAVLRLRGRLDRSALAEITEVDPPELLAVHTDVRVDPARVELTAPALPATAAVTVTVTAGRTAGHPARWSAEPDGEATLAVPGGQQVTVTVVVSLEPDPDPVPETGPEVGPWAGPDPTETPRPPEDPCPELARITRGALRYVRGCTTTAAGAILTDHRLLPLSWTRDAYYQAQLLLAVGDHATVGSHLRWLFLRGRGPDGRWARSQLPDGRPKDHALQADQQLYPLLELADHRDAAGGWPDHPGAAPAERARAWGGLVAQVWQTLPRDGPDGLLVSEESPADERAELPFVLSNQILYWYTATRLDRWSAELGIGRLQLGRVADGLRSAIDRRFRCVGPYGQQWAYESDCAGGRRRYQDANDLPTAFAPLWGFCGLTDPVWTATMRYAFSPHNPGYVAGRFGGLGSAHTPGTWSLGDVQELAVALATTDRDRLEAVVRRLDAVASVDGLLPETYDAGTGAWLARHWFAWPAAVIGTLCLEHLA
ncbi:glycoside hydrolase family 125 protein [Actinophytocola sp.]|uniref:glycoside hydrolase family 125 protein n=1 Tax=Actinophytocola sp. TaxID=1872138 RepID=UPI003D6A7059